MRIFLKVTAAVIVAAVLIVLYLIRFQGLRVERDGSGVRPILSFYRADKHIAAIEENRAPAAVEPPPERPAPIPEAKVAPPTEPTPLPATPYWTDFRGPRRDGHYDEMPVLTNWSPGGPPRLWRKPIGGGYASFVFARGKAFTIEQRLNQEVVAAYDMASGREIWSHGWPAHFQESMGGDGPRATPTWDDGRLFALGAEGELRCLDAQTGRRIWSKNILQENGVENLQWGMAASPLIIGNAVIVLPGAPPDKSVVAYNKLTGNPLWHALDDKAAYSSPMVVTLAGEKQILVLTARRAAGLTAEGKLLWEFPWSTSYDINVAQPLTVGPDRFMVSAGYGHGAAVVNVKKTGDTFEVSRVWENTRMKNKFTSSVFHDGHIYGMDEAVLACVNAENGDLKWKGGRYGYGQLVLASGHLIVLTEQGDIALVRATPEKHEELVRFSAIEGKTWNHPAISEGVLLVRNGTEMAAFRVH